MTDHKKKKKKDKIINNSYKTGEGLKGDAYEFSKSIKVKDDYASSYLKDLYDYENHVEYKIILEKIIAIIENDKKLTEIVFTDVENKKKFNSKEINLIFSTLYDSLEKDIIESTFLNPIYLVEAISKITGLDYKRIFDFLDCKYQEILLVSLDDRFGIFGDSTNNMH